MPVTVKPAEHGPEKRKPYTPLVQNSVEWLNGACRKESQQCKELLQSSFDPREHSTLEASPNGFVHGAITAYNHHHALLIRPEDVWFAILSQFSLFINAHAEEVRGKFVAHQGKKVLTLIYFANRYTMDFGLFAKEMGEMIERNVVDPELRRWMMPAFTTTTQKDTVIASILMMGVTQKYFDFRCVLACGLPSVTLLGDKADWELILSRLEKLTEYGEEPTQFFKLLKPVLSSYWSGWITAFCFWDSDGKSMYTARGLTTLKLDDATYHQIDSDDVPPGYSSVPVRVDDNGVEFDATMIAGFFLYESTTPIQYLTSLKLFFRNFHRFSTSPLRSAITLPLAASTVSFTRKSSAPLPTATAPNIPRRTMHSSAIVIGSGPAAHTAAIYLARAQLNPVLYEGMLANGIAAGGQLTTTTDVENFPGFPKGIGGQELMDNMRAQSINAGTEVRTETIAKVDLSKRPFRVWKEYEEDQEPDTADAIIIATGASARRLGLPGEEQYWQNGISACAVCDGAVPIFRNKPLVVIGGGDSAAEEATFLTKYGSHVTVLVRKEQLRASKTMANRLLRHPKVTVRFNSVATEVVGEEGARGLMTGLKIKNVKTGEVEELKASGLFYAVGHDPASAIVKGQMDRDEDGYILTKPGTTYTSVEGVFAAGDVQDKKYRQAVTSAGSGCQAALEAEKYLADLEDTPVTNGIEGDSEVTKPTSDQAPEYRSNPLL
ncbi:MAG: hypothetical protein LQ352_003290 [Teloschistes flavicans]|nr:MAG: hypothetical protein LQ352_003290 [Teloschistes flavicans]